MRLPVAVNPPEVSSSHLGIVCYPSNCSHDPDIDTFDLAMKSYQHDIHLLSENTGSDSALGFLYAKYQQCQEEHIQCKPPASSTPWYPKRLLDVGESGDDIVRLYNTQSFSGSKAYFTLSHCWGQSRPFLLTKYTAPKLETGIPVHELPKTFQDAVLATRRFLVRYLWIDSLCVI